MTKIRIKGIKRLPLFPQDEFQRAFAFGGNLGTNGSDFTDGLTYFNVPTRHETNPNGGIPLGVAPDGQPNLVEGKEENKKGDGGEIKWNKLEYIFSDRLKPSEALIEKWKLPKAFLNYTYADAVRKSPVILEAEQRPNDPKSLDVMDKFLADVADDQETQKAEKKAAETLLLLDSLSPDELALVNQGLEEQLAMEQELAMQELQAAMALQGLPSPEEMAMMQLLGGMPLLGMPMPQGMPMMGANGGKLYSNGGDLIALGRDDEVNQGAMPPLEMTQGPAAMVPLDGVAPMPELEVPLEGDTPAEGQEAEQEQPFNFDQDAEDLSTNELNDVIDRIIDYATNNNDRKLVRKAKKIKKESRDKKEDFVNDTLDDIKLKEEEALKEQELQEAQLPTAADELAAQELGPVAEELMPEEQLSFPLGQMSEEEMAALAAAMAGNKFEDGGLLTDELRLRLQVLGIPDDRLLDYYWDDDLKEWFRNSLRELGNVEVIGNRPLVPQVQEEDDISPLHLTIAATANPQAAPSIQNAIESSSTPTPIDPLVSTIRRNKKRHLEERMLELALLQIKEDLMRNFLLGLANNPMFATGGLMGHLFYDGGYSLHFDDLGNYYLVTPSGERLKNIDLRAYLSSDLTGAVHQRLLNRLWDAQNKGRAIIPARRVVKNEGGYTVLNDRGTMLATGFRTPEEALQSAGIPRSQWAEILGTGVEGPEVGVTYLKPKSSEPLETSLAPEAPEVSETSEPSVNSPVKDYTYRGITLRYNGRDNSYLIFDGNVPLANDRFKTLYYGTGRARSDIYRHISQALELFLTEADLPLTPFRETFVSRGDNTPRTHSFFYGLTLTYNPKDNSYLVTDRLGQPVDMETLKAGTYFGDLTKYELVEQLLKKYQADTDNPVTGYLLVTYTGDSYKGKDGNTYREYYNPKTKKYEYHPVNPMLTPEGEISEADKLAAIANSKKTNSPRTTLKELGYNAHYDRSQDRRMDWDVQDGGRVRHFKIDEEGRVYDENGRHSPHYSDIVAKDKAKAAAISAKNSKAPANLRFALYSKENEDMNGEAAMEAPKPVETPKPEPPAALAPLAPPAAPRVLASPQQGTRQGQDAPKANSTNVGAGSTNSGNRSADSAGKGSNNLNGFQYAVKGEDGSYSYDPGYEAFIKGLTLLLLDAILNSELWKGNAANAKLAKKTLLQLQGEHGALDGNAGPVHNYAAALYTAWKSIPLLGNEGETGGGAAPGGEGGGTAPGVLPGVQPGNPELYVIRYQKPDGSFGYSNPAAFTGRDMNIAAILDIYDPEKHTLTYMDDVRYKGNHVYTRADRTTPADTLSEEDKQLNAFITANKVDPESLTPEERKNWLAAFAAALNGEFSTKAKMMPTIGRYAPLFDYAGAPDASGAIGLIQNTPNLLHWTAAPRHGEYLKYLPVDLLYKVNQIRQLNEAALRGIMNAANGNTGMLMANMALLNAKSLDLLGQTLIGIDNENWARKKDTVAQHNDVDKTWDLLALEADRANMSNNSLIALANRDAANLMWDEAQTKAAARNATRTNVLQTLSNIGKENFAANQVNSNPALLYGYNPFTGESYYKGLGMMTEADKKRYGINAANGGCLTIKRKRRRQ